MSLIPFIEESLDNKHMHWEG